MIITRSIALPSREVTRRKKLLAIGMPAAMVATAALTVVQHSHFFGWTISDYQQKLVDDVPRIRDAIIKCRQDMAACDERTAGLSEAIDVAAGFARKNPLLAAATIELAVNMLVRYDHQESYDLDHGGDYRAADDALRIGQVVCLEQGTLKFIATKLALEQAGVASDTISIGIEDVVTASTIDQLRENGPPQSSRHGIMTMTVNGQEYTLNNQYNFYQELNKTGGKISEDRIPQLIEQDSTMETIGAQENFWGDSTIENLNEQFRLVAKYDLFKIYPAIEGSVDASLGWQENFKLGSDGHDILARLFKDLAAANDATIVAAPLPKTDRLHIPSLIVLRP